MSVSLDQIVPWGRCRWEYDRMFGLEGLDLSGGVLDCGAGPSSFTTESTSSGIRTVAVDPIYAYSGDEIAARFEATAAKVMSQVRASPEKWVWGSHANPDDLLRNRRLALEQFLGDYELGHAEGRYVVGELPRLPLADGSFGLAVCSHFLFLYSEILGGSFHTVAARELCRVAREVRIFPLLTLGGLVSEHVTEVLGALKSDGWRTEVVKVPYELQPGGNQMLRIFRR